MGVPKFYRWISERYPCLSEVVKEYQIPEFDNLYLDMNGIIHLCSHPNDDDPHFRITEEQIYSGIFHYIECLFRLIKPRKVFFMAVDGVAPRAKMNQQRARRFRSAREAVDLEKRAVGRGEELPKEKRFDSNCITPGTEFMARLHEQLKYFVNFKISTDKMWQGLRIYLSGQETPGEGEHKIMDFIRYEKTQPGYDPNTRHCLYGLDADLIMLGMCTHEPHFSLLREEVRFTGKKSKRIPTPEETTFHLLHLSLLREYLEHEFSPIRDKLPFPFDVEKIVDDWVMMGFLVGNDFIPNLPHLHIVHGALPTLYKTYCDVLPMLDGYINEGGFLNLPRFEKYIERLAQLEYEHFTENTYADLKWLESKKVKTASPEKQRSRSRNKEKDIGGKNQFKVLDGLEMDDFQETDGQEVPVGVLISLSDDDDLEEEEDEDDDDLRELEFGNYKRNYYMDKMAYEQVTPEVLRGQAECFVEAIQWNLHYYYHGVCSWSWYYPHHYAPYISDIKNFSHLKLEFDLGTPFLPFEQLLAVLPAASKFLLPKPYHDLMCNKDSPLVDYYPEDFRTDLNGKQQDWEAVVLIPFIDEERLLNAMRPKNDLLKEEEKNRNRHGPCLLYTYSEKPRGKYPSLSPGRFPDIVINFARCTEIAIEGFAVSRDRLVKGLSKDVRLDVYFPGFPTLKHIPHTAMLKKAEVRVFQGNSRGDNMILTINSQLTLGLFKAAEQYLNKTVFVSWPHLIEAKVISVSNAQCKCRLIEKNGENGPNESRISEEEMSKDKANVWKMEKNSIIEMYKKRWGVEIGETTILIHATPLIGRKYLFCNGGKMTLQKQWSSLAIPYAIQMVVTDIKVQDPSFRQYLTMEEVFKPKTICFMLGTPHYGCMGEVLTCTSKKKDLISVQFEVIPDVDIDQIRFRHESAGDEYFLGCIAAQRLGISGHLFSCITTTLYATLGSKLHPGSSRVNLGLCLKFNKKSEEVPGYTKRSQGTWLYSAKTIEVVNSYLSKFPEMFDYLSKHLQDGNYFVDDMLAQCPPGITLNEIKNFLKSLPSQQVGRQHCGSEIVEKDVITEIEQIIDDYHARMQKKSVVLMVQPHHLYLPGNFQGSSSPDPTTKFYLLDRVVNIREGYTVPLGYRGTIISVQAADKDADVIYEILFDKEFCGGLTLRCSPNRGYRLPAYALINFTHHERQQSHHRQKPMAVVHPRSAKANEHDLYPIMSQSNSKRSKLDRTSSKSAPNSVEGRTATKQACGPSPRHSNAPNTLNHSPNSPFIAKQQRHPLNQSQAPHFVTPKMSTSPQMPSTSWQLMAHQQQVQRLQGPAQQIQSDNEFQNMWKELAAKSSPDLVQAAKSLPKQHQSLPPRRSWNRIIALDKPEVVHQGGPPPMPAFGTKAVGEYSQMLHALESQSKIQESQEPPVDVNSKNSNADLNNLLQQLKLAHPEEKRTTASTIKMSSTKPDSRQLTVQQLFKDARDPLLPDPPKKLEVTSPEIQDARQLKRGKPESGSYVMNLMNIIQARYNTMPLYEYLTVGPSQMISARVKLPDDRFFNGGIAATKEEAAEWAAQCALAEIMTAPSFGKPSGTHHATLNPSAVAHHMTGMPMQMNAVYPPVIVPSGLPHPMHPLSAGPYTPYHQGNMAPVYQIRHPYHPYPHAYAGAPQIQPHMRWPVQGVWQADRQSEWASTRSGPNFQYDQSNICRTNNAFIPLQVIKQNVTPKRTTSISRPLDDGDMVVINAPSSQHNVVNPRVTHIASSSSGGGYQKPASGMPPQNLTQREKGQALDHQNKPSKRPRSRLAIRFDGRQT